MSQVSSVQSTGFTQPKWLNVENLGKALITVIAISAIAAMGLCMAGYLGVSHLPLNALISINVGSGIVALTSMIALYILCQKKDLAYATHTSAEDKMVKQTEMAKEEGKVGKKTIEGDFTYYRTIRGIAITTDQNISGPNGAAETRGLRPNMEDTHCVKEFTLKDDTHVRFAGVFDGHGDNGNVAKMLSEKFPQYLEQQLYPLNDKQRNPETLGNLFTKICYQLEQEALKISGGEGGSTAVCSLVMDGKIYTINVGDSRAVQIKKGEGIQLTEDASPDNPRFAETFKKYKTGNVIFKDELGNDRCSRGYENKYSLGLTRDFGVEFAHWKPKITRSEYVPEKDYLVVACDGLWDVCNAKEAHQAVSDLANQGKPPSEIASTLVKGALLSGTRDNVTVVVLKL